MKKIYITIAAAILCLGAQAQEMPKPSPSASVMQSVGLTDITVEYSRPGVKDRTIWGDLVPYGEIWRAGANKATKFSTNADILIEGEQLPAGDYSLFILPTEGGDWTLIWNTETELWGAGDYKEEQDALRIQLEAQDIECVSERLEYRFIDVNMESAVFAMDWAGKRLHVSIEADPSDQVMANIETAIKDSDADGLWRVYRNAASYANDKGMTAKGLEWIAKSVELKESWYSYWVYGELLAQNKEYKKAVKMGKKAIEIGKKESDDFSYESRIQADVDSWSKM